MKVIVTGAAGFIGSHTCERLVSQGHEVVGIDSFNSHLYPEKDKRRNAEHLEAVLDAAQFLMVEADICDAQAMAGIFERGRADVLCHLAALAGVRPSLLAPADYVRTNLGGTVNLLEQCHRTGVDRVVCASSSSVYGVRDTTADPAAFCETDLCVTPASPYAATKRAAELLCSTYRDLYGLGITNLRFFTVFGPRQRPDMAMHKFIRGISAGQPITLYGDGSSRRDYTYIDDIVGGVCSAIARVEPCQFETYNLGGTVTTTLHALVSVIEEVVGNRAVIDRQPNQPGDVPITFADITRAREDLGYRPTVSVREGLTRFWTWYQERG